MGRRFELRTDHCGLKYLFDQPTLNARQARWMEFLCEFDFEIKHIKGKEIFCGMYRCMRTRASRSPYAGQPRDML